jgi:signal transduction histidine kinase
VDVDVDPEMTVQIDRDMFSRIIENMLDNAARYAPRGGRCAVTVKRNDRGTEIAIGNSGPPVPPAERDKIFGRYFQVERRRASARANRGLGLYFCKLAVEAHGGTIHVEERGDLGAVFVVQLPPD